MLFDVVNRFTMFVQPTERTWIRTVRRTPGEPYNRRQIYKVDNDIVLKTGRIFEPPTANASSQERWFYASETIFQSNLMKNEKFVMRLLHQHPHPNLVEVIDADHPEGIYLRNYRRMWELDGAAPASRLQWYRDITDALAHLHKLGIAHADLRMENMVFDARGCAILCEFSASTPVGEPNHVFPDQPVPINGVAPTISDATDRFAMGTLIFQMEHGVKPGFEVGVGGSLVLPEVRTGHSGLDSVIRKAWSGQYSNTEEMLEQIESLKCGGRQPWDLHSKGPSRELLEERVLRWRECRMKQFGYVLEGVPSEEELRDLARQYGWNKDEGLRFVKYRDHLTGGLEL
ncbi:serine/threonine protein kinase [Aspergillus terreus]|uniref:Serine/threonine protein kinase n=1 Tax=Aspergillus terreus TaxID=33178 RepID=A0A5M3Z8P7_ASPTE|nr:hypothetical protein ATETN484_0011044500 [Aspergillus terreus]GFF19087.1 serine/threonine protein kinase [Aspergillus terreus]